MALKSVDNDAALLHEFKLLFDRVRDDPCMALARARRLLEVMIIDRYLASSAISTSPLKDLPTLYDAIESLSKRGDLNRVQQALAHSIRVEGNRAIHYQPEMENYGKKVIVADDVLKFAINGLIELTCIQKNSETPFEVFKCDLPQQFQEIFSGYESMLSLLREESNTDKEDIVSLEMMLRSVVNCVRAEDLDLLRSCAEHSPLPASDKISSEKEHSYIRLRNAGLLAHDRAHLFKPIRSSVVSATNRGRLLLTLTESYNRLASFRNDLFLNTIREEINFLNQTFCNEDFAPILVDLHQKGGNTNGISVAQLRKLRNSLLIANQGRFLESENLVKITHLGYYCLGKFLNN